jgi:hypothetical protein
VILLAVDFSKMIDLGLLSKDQRRILWYQVRNIVRDEGRSARVNGIPITHRPSFQDPEMEENWKLGWRFENEERGGWKIAQS